VDTPRAPEPEPELAITSQTADDVCLIRLSGEVDERSADRVTAALEDAIASGVRAVVLDLCAVSFMDSRGLWALIRARRAMSRRSVVFALACSPHGEAGRLLALTGMTTAFEVYPSGGEALDAVLGPGRTKLEDPTRVSAQALEDIERRLEAMLDDLAARPPLVPPDPEATG
jgi:anti-sigma B factor antagonist